MNKYSIIILIMITPFILMRFINLRQDFPREFTDGGFVLTDEGWYCNGAINKIDNGSWYIENGFNNMPFIPVNHIVSYVAFSVFGKNIETARIIQIVFYLFYTLILLLICNYITKDIVVSLAAIFPVATSWFLFAYTRVALLEYEMLAFTSLSILLSLKRKYLLSGIAITISFFVKSSAVFAIPCILIIPLLRKENFYKILIPISFIPIYLYWSYIKFPSDFKVFFGSNVTNRTGLSIVSTLLNIGIFQKEVLLISIVGFVYNYKKGYSYITLLAVTSVLMLSLNSYSPYRYFIILSMPITLMLSVAAIKSNRNVILISCVVLFAINLIGVYKYISKPTYNIEKSISASSKILNGNKVYGVMTETAKLYDNKINISQTATKYGMLNRLETSGKKAKVIRNYGSYILCEVVK